MTDLAARPAAAADPAAARFDRGMATTFVKGKPADPTDTKLDRKNAPADIGSSGLKRSSGIVLEEFDPQLKGAKANKIYVEMATDPIIGGALLLISQWMAGATWSVVPFAPDVPDYEDDALFVEQCMGDMSHAWESGMAEAGTDVQFGWSWAHVVYKVRNGVQDRPGDSSKYTDGKWGWRKFSFKGQDTLQRWEFDEEGGIVGWWQRTIDRGLVFLPISRGLLFRTTTAKGNPEGRSLLRSSYVPWWEKKKLSEIEGIGHERNLVGFPVVYISREAFDDSTVRAEWEKLAFDTKIDEQMGAVLPTEYAVDDDGKVSGHKLYSMELLASPGTSNHDIGATIDRKSREMAMALLADVILMGHESGGVGSSQAVAITKDDMLKRSMMKLLTDKADVLNRHEIPRLFRLNGKVSGELPHLEVTPPDSTTAQQILDALKTLADTGAALWPSAELAEFVQARTGIPIADVMDEQDDAEDEEPVPKPMPEPDDLDDTDPLDDPDVDDGNADD